MVMLIFALLMRVLPLLRGRTCSVDVDVFEYRDPPTNGF